MTTGKKVAIGCLGSLVLTILIGFLVVQWAKRKVISVVAETVQVEVVAGINKSFLPDDQKAAFITAVDEILEKISSGDIDFTFSGEFKDKEKSANIIAEALKNAVHKLSIEGDQKEAIGIQVDRFKDAYISEALSNQQVESIVGDLVTGQFGTLVSIWFMETAYINGAGLSQEEKSAAQLTLGRLAKGIKSGKITDKETEAIMAPYSVTDNNGNTKIKDLSDDEIREIMVSTNKLLEEKEVSQEPMQFDIGQELKEALDSAEVP